MSFGLTTWKADGTPVITAQGAGGVFIEFLQMVPGNAATTKYYYGIVGMALRVFQVYAGSFTWNTGVTWDGIPYITINALPATYNGGQISLLIFAE